MREYDLIMFMEQSNMAGRGITCEALSGTRNRGVWP